MTLLLLATLFLPDPLRSSVWIAITIFILIRLVWVEYRPQFRRRRTTLRPYAQIVERSELLRIRGEIRTARRQKWVLRAAMLIALVTATGVLLLGAHWDSQAVQSGYGRPAVSFLGVPINSRTAYIALITPANRADTSLARIDDHCLLYMGTSDGLSIFYNYSTRQTVRIPAAQITISVPLPSSSTAKSATSPCPENRRTRLQRR